MDDPMAQYFASKRMDALSAADAAAPSAVHATELGEQSGFSVPQQVPEHSWIRRGVQALPNRYKIKPGRHWDGVHRSNGFEHKFVFQYQHKKAERARDEYVLAEDL
jgi:pre-mRNA-splicing factor CWC26